MKRYILILGLILFALNSYEIQKKIISYKTQKPETKHNVRDETVEIFYHDGNAAGSFYELFNYGYGTVFNLNNYPDATLESIDFHHSSYGLMGPHIYNIHIIDWNSHETISVLENLTTTVNDNWETGIELGSLTAPSQVGIFLEPLSNTPDDAYPDLDYDSVLNNASYMIDLTDNSIVDPGQSYGDYLINLWISVPEQSQNVLDENFLLGIPDNWAEIDADGDSFGWENYDGAGHDDTFCVRSGSYIDGIGVVHPDNYLITPQILIANENYHLQFWVKPLSEYFYAEHYKVKIAVTDSTNLEPDYFTDTIYEETLQPGDWQMREIYLNDYLNQKIYIAWEHCNVSDQYYLLLDDIVVSDSLTSSDSDEIASQSILLRNYPNPFRNSTTISFQINTKQNEQNEQKTLSIFNVRGQKIRTLECINSVDAKTRGSLSYTIWNGKDDFGKKVSAGVYLYRLNIGNKSVAEKKCILIR